MRDIVGWGWLCILKAWVGRFDSFLVTYLVNCIIHYEQASFPVMHSWNQL